MSKKVVALACAVALGLFLIVPVSKLLHYILDGLGLVGVFSASVLAIILPIVIAYFAYRRISTPDKVMHISDNREHSQNEMSI